MADGRAKRPCVRFGNGKREDFPLRKALPREYISGGSGRLGRGYQ